MKRLCAALLLVSLAVALPAAVLGSDLFPKPPVPSSRNKITTANKKTGQSQNSGSQGTIKLGKVAKGSEASKTTTTKPPASLQ